MPLSELFAQWEFFRDAILASVLAGAVLGGLGVYLIARRMVFFSAALTQVSGLGVVLSLIIWGWITREFATELSHEHGANLIRMFVLTGGAFGLSAVASLLLARGASERGDQRLGLAWVLSTGLILMLGGLVDRHEIPNITLWMFSGRGDAGLLPEGDFPRLAIVFGLVAALHAWWFRAFVATTIDPVGARVRGLPVGWIDSMLLVSLAAATSVGGAVLGMLPVFAYSVLPAMAALALAWNLPSAIAGAVVAGALAAFVGYLIAFRFGFPVGAAQAVTAAAIAGATQSGASLYRRWSSARRGK